ncbi:7fe6b43f-d362-4d17-a62d-94c47311d6b1 [Thermothielavioides terrestris]|uniref:7fe6b43f-d362-4d17-a62d-94c47311d6b1 n=1 Tax=Thermothielavioides terrestris TaxID=2587410 RepID=A0A446BEB7_9PEZI|nr:7fe6b43f-d362-4d17-a62d-94c47311d6b1 [Thermothielavioides terrestris]
MTSFVCNDPATIGYSAFCDENPYYIRSHTAGERDLSFYDSWSPKTPEMRKAGWLYIPVGVDERITEVWVRSYVCGLVTETFAVIFRTNKGRCLVLGSHPASGGGNYQYALVCRPAEHGPSRIYFDLSLYGIHSLAVDTPLPSGAVVLPSPAPPVSPCPELGPYEIFTYTSAALDGVVEVTPCRSDVAEFGPAITGLLLRYADGRQASLGQVRLDRLEQPVKVAE